MGKQGLSPHSLEAAPGDAFIRIRQLLESHLAERSHPLHGTDLHVSKKVWEQQDRANNNDSSQDYRSDRFRVHRFHLSQRNFEHDWVHRTYGESLILRQRVQ
jgi:hypothetical protein